MAEEKWDWVYACVAGTGEMLFQVPADVKEALLSGPFPETFPFRNITMIKPRQESPEETAARAKRGPAVPDLVIETFQWLMTQEGAVGAGGRMSGRHVAWAMPPTEEISQAASETWGEKRVFVANRSHLAALGG